MQQNLMMVLEVSDLDQWYQRVIDAGVFDRFEAASIGEPKLFPWGIREVHFIDPAGVCWHVAGQ